MRQGRRQSSRRSTASSNSPASAFLSRFAREESSAAPDDEGQEVGEYVLGRQIGFGGSSVVKEAFTIEGDRRVCRAVKIVRKQVANKDDLENERVQAEFEREVGLWRCLSHRHILSLIAVHVTPFATFCFTQLSSGGTLFDLVRANRQGLRGDRARRHSYQLASAIRYLHEDMRVVHRDIKLENCLIDVSHPTAHLDGGNLLLCDFGLAEFEINDHSRESPDPPGGDGPSTGPGPPVTNTCFVGSLEYASPELILGPPNFFSRVVDVWAFGVVMYALLLGDLPFQHPLPSRVQHKILAGEWDAHAVRRAPGAAGTEDEVLEVMHGCLNMRSEERWVIRQVLDSRWLYGCPEMLEEISAGWKL
jgi:serine/threonine protein kinase